MTLNRRVLKKVNSPLRSPCRANTSLRKKALIKRISGEVQFGADSKANLKVVVRVRPFNAREEENNARCVVDVVDEHMLVFDPQRQENSFFFKGIRQKTRDFNKRQPREQKFAFERIFSAAATNDDVYQATTQDLMDNLLQGYNCSVFAYGATGAGKTHTMLGTKESPGITFLTLMELYQRLDDISERKCEVAVSYLEIYNETVRDLLCPGKLLQVQEVGQQVVVPGLSLHKPGNTSELMEMLARGNQNRTQHPTDANAESSRSHAVFQVFVKQQQLAAVGLKSNVIISKLSMIDLAGSERGLATGFKGARFREGANINRSLLALGNCINALADGLRHIPYRDSKLTRLLKDSLGGNCRSVMIAAISPASTTFEDTFNTLRYANRAKTIKTTIKKNLLNVDQHVSNYVKIVEDLREEVCSLKRKLKTYEEREAEWKKERATLTDAMANSSKNLINQTHQDAFTGKVMKVSSEDPRTEEQANLESIEALQELIREQKVLRSELLKLEGSQREVEFKIHTCTMHLERMKIISFTSQKLDKSIARCERTFRNLHARLAHILQHKKEVEAQLATSMTHLSQSQNQSSDHILDKLNTKLAINDYNQHCQYLERIVSESFSEQRSSEQLVRLLLNASRQFYVELRADNNCTPSLTQVFQGVVDSLDESKIAWADQQEDGHHLEDSQRETVDPAPLTNLDVPYFTRLPIPPTVLISPTVTQELPSVRKSSLKSSSCTTPHLPQLPPHTPVPARHPLHTVVEEEISDKAVTTPLSTNVVIESHAKSPNLTEQKVTALLTEPGTEANTQIPLISVSETASAPKSAVSRCLNLSNVPETSFGIPSISQTCGVTAVDGIAGASSSTDVSEKEKSQEDLVNTTPFTPVKLLETPIKLPSLSNSFFNNTPVKITLSPSLSKLSLNSTMNISGSHFPSISNLALTDIKSNSPTAVTSKDGESVIPENGSEQLQARMRGNVSVSQFSNPTTKIFSSKSSLNSTFVLNDTDLPSLDALSFKDEPSQDKEPGSLQVGRDIETLQPLSLDSNLDVPPIAVVETAMQSTTKSKVSRKAPGCIPHTTTTPGKVPGAHINTLLGKNKMNSMKRSTSTPTLVAGSSFNKFKSTPPFRRKFRVGAHQSTTNLVARGTNQENVPPGSTRKTGNISSLYRETVASAAKHSLNFNRS